MFVELFLIYITIAHGYKICLPNYQYILNQIHLCCHLITYFIINTIRIAAKLLVIWCHTATMSTHMTQLQRILGTILYISLLKSFTERTGITFPNFICMKRVTNVKKSKETYKDRKSRTRLSLPARDVA